MPEDNPEQPVPDVSGVREDIEAAVQKRREQERLERQRQKARAQGGEEDAQADGDHLTDEELEEKAQKRRKIAQLLQRGFVNHRLDPRQHLGDAYDPNRHYEWVRDREDDISRVVALGARVENKPDGETPEGTHGTADGRIRLADVVLVSFDRVDYEIIEEVREEKKEQRRGANAGRQEYLNKVKRSDAAPAIQPER